jgi:hypothetical protein
LNKDANEIRITPDQFSQLVADVSKKVTDAGFAEHPAFLMQFQPDE